jgi:hypothetical protein
VVLLDTSWLRDVCQLPIITHLIPKPFEFAKLCLRQQSAFSLCDSLFITQLLVHALQMFDQNTSMLLSILAAFIPSVLWYMSKNTTHPLPTTQCVPPMLHIAAPQYNSSYHFSKAYASVDPCSLSFISSYPVTDKMHPYSVLSQ